MNIAVIGAHGKSGQAFVIAALAAGHSVRAGIRGNNPFADHTSLTVMTCDATNATDIAALIANQEAVVSLLGHRRGSQHNAQTQAMQTIIQLNEAQKFQHVVTLTGTGVRMPNDQIRFIDTIITALLKIVDPHRMNDGAEHVKQLQQSSLNYTILRVFKLTNGPEKPFALLINGPAALTASRKTVAAAINAVLADDRFNKQAPMICAPQK